jgi:multiple antibiotic resistance protein
MLETGLAAFVTLVVIMDPLGNVPIFLALSKPLEPARRPRVAAQAVAVAFGLIAAFALAGARVLDYLGVTLESLSIAGGLLLVLVALELLRGEFDVPRGGSGLDIALVPLATPLLAGPGAIAATIVLVEQNSGGRALAATWVGIVAAFIAVWVVLRLAVPIGSALSVGLIRLISRVMGVLLAAIAVELILNGIRDWIEAHPGL